MTTLEGFNGAGEINRRLDEVMRRRRWVRLGAGLASMVALLCCSVLAAGVVGGYWPGQPPPWLRWGLLALLCTLCAGGTVVWLLRPLLWRQSPAQNARFVEERRPELGNGLINSVLLAQDAAQVSPPLVQEAIREVAEACRSADLCAAVSRRTLHRRLLLAGMALLATGLFASLQPQAVRRGAAAVFSPKAYVPSFGTVRLLAPIDPGDATVFAGQPVTVTARVANDAGRAMDGEVVFEDGTVRPMLATRAYSVFALPLGPATQSFAYAVRVGDTRWPSDRPWYRVTVLRRIEAERIQARCEYPPYTRLEPRTVELTEGAASFEVPLGTQVHLMLQVCTPVPVAILDRAQSGSREMAPGENAAEFATSFRAENDETFRFLLRDETGRDLQAFPSSAAGPAGAAEAGAYAIRVLGDPPPVVELASPGRDVSVPPDGSVRLRIRASDRYGLDSVTLLAGLVGETPRALRTWSPDAKPSADLEYDLSVSEDFGGEEGQEIVYYAVARDGRDIPPRWGPQTTESERFKVSVRDPAQVAQEREALYERLRRQLQRLLDMQARQRVRAGVCLERKRETPASTAADTPAGEMLTGQRAIRTEMASLVREFPFAPEMASVHQALALLAANEAQTATDQAEVFAQSLDGDWSRPESAALGARAAHGLFDTQERIIDVLEMLLAVVPSLKSGGSQRAASDREEVPPEEALTELKELRSKLGEFIDAEKKAIDASVALVRKGVEDFTPEDRRLLQELKAVQDQWEKFLEAAVSELSRLAEQDFSNPLLLKELISVKTDVTMARDALSQQAVEIATAMEQNGVENAETLTANIEKWLPDEPDRKKWAMEALDEQENLEMADLPTELEDLVGDLLEEEEDLFDEIDDITSKASTSGDIGIGWDTFDGPISSMNAQGVTGNQLPNSSEISGRSAEGRTGKSSGEYVEDKAVGKGGRRTPTRLTPEPFQRGQIDDRSGESPGGATGGGKVSGAGAEGLEGPVPPPVADELRRLAGKQASLIGRARKLQASLRVGDYSNFALLHAITLMDRVRSDLENLRYRNVLRARRGTLEALRNSRLLLAGEVEVSADASSALPKHLRRDIADAMQRPGPAEYRRALEQYYRRIAQEASAR